MEATEWKTLKWGFGSNMLVRTVAVLGRHSQGHGLELARKALVCV
ncbi:hypothetical protein J2Z50_005341 [Ensifer mexicanus]|nr:hypothetical protein [Sinorhizobium mexicanum]